MSEIAALPYERDPPAEGAVIDARTLNRTLLARQLLLARSEAHPLDLLERLIGMQAQVPLDPYIACWSRLSDFDPEVLGRRLLERTAVRMTLMRATLHLASRTDVLSLRPLLQGMLERAFRSSPFARELGEFDLVPALDWASELLGREPQTLAQLRIALAQEWPAEHANALAYAIRYLLPLVQVTPRGVWGRSMQPTVTTLEEWLGAPPSAGSLEELVLRYLRAFGPASVADMRTWSWLRDLRQVFTRLRRQLRAYRDEAGRELFDARDGLFADAAAPAPVRFLGQYDNVFLSHDDRGRIMASLKWDASFAHRGTLFLDGYLAGAWKLARTARAASLTVEPRIRIRATQRQAIRAEAEALLVFLAPDTPSRSLHMLDT